MNNLTKQAQPAVEKLLKSDEDQLYEQLGIRAKAIEKDLVICSSFDPHVIYNQAEMGLMDDIKELGKRFFNRWNKEAYKFLCGTGSDDEKDRRKLQDAIEDGALSAATILSALLVTNLGLAPAIAAVIAVLIIKRFFRPTYEEFCKFWKKKLPQED